MSANLMMDSAAQSSFLGNTIEEKTRRILGWTEDYAPSCVPPNSALAQAQVSAAVAAPAPPPPPPPPPPPSSAAASSAAPQPTAPLKIPNRKNRKLRNTPPSVPYPYSLIGNDSRSRKSSVSSVSSVGSDSILKQQLTPPQSPSPQSTVSLAKLSLVSKPQRKSSDSYGPFGPLPVSPVSPNTPNPYGSGGSQRGQSNQGARGVTDSRVFERLRELVPHIPADQNAYHVLIQTVTNVIELEHELEQLKEKTRGVRCMLQNRRQQMHHASGTAAPMNTCRQTAGTTQNPVLTCYSASSSSSEQIAPSQMPQNAILSNGNRNWDGSVPEDLAQVDVSAFKCLVTEGSRVSAHHQPMVSSSGSGWDGGFVGDFDLDLFISGAASHVLDPLTVDTSSFCC